MVRLKCPNCANVIDAPAGTAPRCPACGFTGATPHGPPPATPFSPIEAPVRGHLQRPGWVVMVAVFQFIGGGLLVLGGLLVATVGGVFAQFLGAIGDAIGGLIVIVGILMLVFGVLEILLGTQVLKGREWARIVSLVLAFLAGAFDLFGLIAGNVMGIFSLAIDVLIIVGLLMPQTKAWFQQEDQRRAIGYAPA